MSFKFRPMNKIIVVFLLTFSFHYSYSQNNGNGVSDLDGNDYQTVLIGSQEWMASNLKTTTFSNGDSIVNIADSALWSVDYSGGWCYFQNDQSYDSLFGKLYNFFVIQDGRNVCPNGWKVPAKEDWEQLVNYLGPDAGNKLKITGTTLWEFQNADATNETGFSGYPSGNRYGSGGFPSTILGAYATWWTSTSEGNSQGWYADLYYANGGVGYGYGGMRGGLPVRCIKSSSSGINNQTIKKVNIFPNPSQTEIRIQNVENAENMNYIIYDSRGLIVLSGKLTDESIDISELENGVYNLELNRPGFIKLKVIKY